MPRAIEAAQAVQTRPDGRWRGGTGYRATTSCWGVDGEGTWRETR